MPEPAGRSQSATESTRTDQMTDVNRANWNVWAAAHGQDAYYDRAALLAGEDSLT